MTLSRLEWSTVVLSGMLSAFGFWGFWMTLALIPAPILSVAGTISSAEAHRRKGRISLIRFTVSPRDLEFTYPDILRNTETVWNAIEVKQPVEVLYTDRRKPELWGLKLAGTTLLTPEAAYAARRENGYWALAIGIAFLLSLLYLLLVQGRKHSA